MKFENLDNLKLEEITEKEVSKEDIGKISIQDIEKEIEELDAIKKEEEMSSLKKTIKKAVVGISIVLSSMIATEALAGGISDKEKKEIRGKASDILGQLDIETEKMREKSPTEIIKEKKTEQIREERFETPKKSYSVDELFNYLEGQEKQELAPESKESGENKKETAKKEKLDDLDLFEVMERTDQLGKDYQSAETDIEKENIAQKIAELYVLTTEKGLEEGKDHELLITILGASIELNWKVENGVVNGTMRDSTGIIFGNETHEFNFPAK